MSSYCVNHFTVIARSAIDDKSGFLHIIWHFWAPPLCKWVPYATWHPDWDFWLLPEMWQKLRLLIMYNGFPGFLVMRWLCFQWKLTTATIHRFRNHCALGSCRISCQCKQAFLPHASAWNFFLFFFHFQWMGHDLCFETPGDRIRSPDCGPLSQDQTLLTDWHNDIICPFPRRFASYSHIQMPPFLSADANRLRTLLHAHANTALGWCFREFSVSFKRRLHTRTEPSIDPADT